MFAGCFCLEGGGQSEWRLSPTAITQAVSPGLGFIFLAHVGNCSVGPGAPNLCGGPLRVPQGVHSQAEAAPQPVPVTKPWGPAVGPAPAKGPPGSATWPRPERKHPGSSAPGWIFKLGGAGLGPLQPLCTRGLPPAAATPGPFHPDVCLRGLNSCGHLPALSYRRPPSSCGWGGGSPGVWAAPGQLCLHRCPGASAWSAGLLCVGPEPCPRLGGDTQSSPGVCRCPPDP